MVSLSSTDGMKGDLVLSTQQPRGIAAEKI